MLPEVTRCSSPCSLPSWQGDSHFYDALFLFFPEKFYWSCICLKWFISTFLSPSLVAQKIPKTLKAPPGDAESPLDVLGIQVRVHQRACHQRSLPCTEAQTLTELCSSYLYSTSREGRRGWERTGRRRAASFNSIPRSSAINNMFHSWWHWAPNSGLHGQSPGDVFAGTVTI